MNKLSNIPSGIANDRLAVAPRQLPLSGVRDLYGNTNPAFVYYSDNITDSKKTPIIYDSHTGTVSNFTIEQGGTPQCTSTSKGGTPNIAIQEMQFKILNDSILKLQNKKSTVESLLDNKQTNLLLNVINEYSNTYSTQNNEAADKLEKLLVNNSLLSDTVLIALLTSQNQLPEKNIQSILLANMPVSDNVLQYVNDFNAEATPVVEKSLNNAQYNTKSHQTITTINQKIKEEQIEKNGLLRNILDYYLTNKNYNKVTTYLENEKTDERYMQLVGMYLYQHDYKNAEKYLKKISLNSAENIAFNELYSIYIELGNTGKTYFEMDSVQKIKVHEIAKLCPVSTATVNAQVLLRSYFNENIVSNCAETVQPIISNHKKFKSKGSSKVTDISDVVDNKKSFIGNNIPNPFNIATRIPYYIADNNKKVEIVICDLTGRILTTFPLNDNEIFIDINLDYLPGIYSYSLRINNQIIDTKRMILLK